MERSNHMMTKTILVLVYFLYAISSYSTNMIRVSVKDEASLPLSYCDVALLSKLYLVTGDDGTVFLDASLCEVGDTLRIRYLGYENLDVVISQQFLETASHVFNLIPKTYALGDVEVSAAFDAEQFFRKKKKKMLLPFDANHTLSILAKVSYIDKDGKPKNLSGRMTIACLAKKYSIVENTDMQDSLVEATVLRSLQLSSYIPYSFCLQRFRKHFDINYIGIQEGRWNFLLSVKPEFVTHPFTGFQVGDNLSTQVDIGQDGFVFSAETRAVIHSGASRSYTLYTEYANYKSQLAAVYINAMLHKEKTHVELFCEYE